MNSSNNNNVAPVTEAVVTVNNPVDFAYIVGLDESYEATGMGSRSYRREPVETSGNFEYDPDGEPVFPDVTQKMWVRMRVSYRNTFPGSEEESWEETYYQYDPSFVPNPPPAPKAPRPIEWLDEKGRRRVNRGDRRGHRD